MALILGDIADSISRSVERVGDVISSAVTESTIRLGVTGLSRSGKTVFIASLVANLIDRGRMQGLVAAADGRVLAAFLQPQPDYAVPRFEYEAHLGRLVSPEPSWPDSTRAVSQLRLSFRVQPGGALGGFRSPQTVHLDIVDYPGEWLLDLELLDRDYRCWSNDALARAIGRNEAKTYLKLARETDSSAPLDELEAAALARSYTRYLRETRAAGYSDCAPGRFLLPGELEGSPALAFAPLPKPGRTPRDSLWREMERRFDAYKREVAKPFFRDHFGRIDRQVVLIDVLGTIHAGPRAVDDLRRSMAGILGAFRPGRNAFLGKLLRGRRVEKILFAATKADHLHHAQHARLSAIMDAMVKEARARADFAGSETAAMAIAALRATVEETIDHGGEPLDCVRGTPLDGGKPVIFYPGELPENPQSLLGQARQETGRWLDVECRTMTFAPTPLMQKPGDGPPHIRLDRAAQFLIGDRL